MDRGTDSDPDVTGPVTTAGTRYTVWFGRLQLTVTSRSTRPISVRTRFDSWLLRGVEQATFETRQRQLRIDRGFGLTGSILDSWEGSGRSGRTGAASGANLTPSFG